MDYNFIIDPLTMKKYDLHSTAGKEIVNNYLIRLQHGKRQVGGGNGSTEGLQGHASPCGVVPQSMDPPCFPDFDTTSYKNPCKALPLDSVSRTSGGRRSRRNRRIHVRPRQRVARLSRKNLKNARRQRV